MTRLTKTIRRLRQSQNLAGIEIAVRNVKIKKLEKDVTGMAETVKDLSRKNEQLLARIAALEEENIRKGKVLVAVWEYSMDTNPTTLANMLDALQAEEAAQNKQEQK